MQARLDRLRRPPDQQRRRHHQLRAARARPADARVRSGEARRARPSSCAARAPARRLTTLDGKERTLDADMLVIADAERAQAIGGVMGGADSEVSRRPRSDRVRERVVQAAVGARDEQAAGPAHRGVVPLRARRRPDRARRGDGARARAARSDRRRPPRAAPSSTVYPAPYIERELITSTPARIERLLGMDVPDDDAERILESLGFGVQTLGGWQAERAGCGHADGRRPAMAGRSQVPGWRVDIAARRRRHRRGRTSLRLRTSADTFPAVEQPPPPSDPRIARDARVRRALLGDGLQRGDHVRVHRDARRRRRFSASDAAGRAGESAVREVHDAAAEPAARTDRRRQPQPPARPARRAALRNRHALLAARRNARRRRSAWTGAATPEHWSGGRRDVDFFDVKGVAEQLCAVAGASPPSSSPATVPYLVDGPRRRDARRRSRRRRRRSARPGDCRTA